jgi:hypothetical protein
LRNANYFLHVDVDFCRVAAMADELDWIASPRGLSASSSAEERMLVEQRDKIEVIGWVTDAEACYSYDDYALIRLGKVYYLLNTSGCSCPAPDETWGIVAGPMSLSKMREHIVGELGKATYGPTARQRAEFVAMVDKAKEMAAAKRKPVSP